MAFKDGMDSKVFQIVQGGSTLAVNLSVARSLIAVVDRKDIDGVSVHSNCPDRKAFFDLVFHTFQVFTMLAEEKSEIGMQALCQGACNTLMEIYPEMYENKETKH